MNAMEDGGQFDPTKRVEISRVRTAGLLMYVVRDPGPDSRSPPSDATRVKRTCVPSGCDR